MIDVSDKRPRHLVHAPRRRQANRAERWLCGLFVVPVVIALAGCGGMSAADGEAAASKARGQVVPAATVLYGRFVAAAGRAGANSGRPPDIESGRYVQCGQSGTRLHYSVSLGLYPFSRTRTSLSAYGRQLVTIATASGWVLHRESLESLPSRGPFVNPAGLDPSTMVYVMTNRAGSAAPIGALFAFPQPGTGVGGSITINSACFDAGPAYAKLSTEFVESPLPAAAK